MSPKAHIRFRHAAVIIFLFVNCVIAGAPIAYATSSIKAQVAHPGNLSAGQSESEENNHYKNSADRYEYQHTIRKKQSTRFSHPSVAYKTAWVASNCIDPDENYVTTSFPERPGYYQDLFLHQVF